MREDDGEQKDPTVLGLDNVPLDLPVAGIGSRLLAGFVDYVVIALVAVAWFTGVAFLTGALHLHWGWSAAILVLGYFALEYGYFAGLELARGRTLGKWALDLRVATRSGGRPGPAALLLRNLVRSVDLAVGVPLMAFDPLARRLGDRLGGTLVLHRPEARRQLELRRVPPSWGPREIAVLESFLERSPDMDPARCRAIARRFLHAVARSDPHFLDGHDPSLDPLAELRRAFGLVP